MKDKAFWVILILGTGPVGAFIYCIQRRSDLLEQQTDSVGKIITPAGLEIDAIDNRAVANSPYSNVVKSVGMAIGVILAVGGILFVGFFIFVAMAFSSYGSNK